MTLELDPRFTFDAFIVGPANRLAVAAARRVADAPGTTYNPLFIYSGSGLGKTHLLSAIGHQVRRIHDAPVTFQTLEHLIDTISAAVEAGERDAFRGRLRDVGVLLLDDVQFVAGQRQVQEELIRAWDYLSARGGQVVLTSDRPPQEIDRLDERLLTRLSGGLIVDMAAPDYETRVAIARRKADERGQRLSPEVYQVLARIAFTNVRELQGALNRLIAVQELEQRTVMSDEVTALLGAAAAERGRDEFGEFLSDVTGTVSAVVEEGDRRIADAILAWEGEGYRTRRLDSALSGTVTTAQAEALIQRFELDVARLREIEGELRALDPDGPEVRSETLRDPDRVAEAETLLARVRERQKPPPAPPPGITLGSLTGDSLARRAAAAVVENPGTAYAPLYVLGPQGSGRTSFLAAIGNGIAERHGLTVAYVDAEDFSAELIEALEHNRLEAWRARYRLAEVLLLDDLHRIEGTERAQEELFHLFEDLQRKGRQLVFSASTPPQDLPVQPRLRSRLESGLVVELDPPAAPAASPARAEGAEGAEDTEAVEGTVATALSEAPAPSQPRQPSRAAPGELPTEAAGSVAPTGERSALQNSDRPTSEWVLSREKVLWEWPYAEDWLEESLD